MPSSRSAFVESVERHLETAGIGDRKRLGGGLLVDLGAGTLLRVGEGSLEITLCAPHEAEPGEEAGAEDAREALILAGFREGLGGRLRERGWQETDVRTTESTLAGAEVVPGTVTEIVCRLETPDPEAAASEIAWISQRL